MNKNYDDEATQFVDSPSMNQETVAQAQQEEKPQTEERQGRNWKQPAMGAASGLVVGVASTVLMGSTEANAMDGEGGASVNPANNQNESAQPAWVDDQVSVATTVSDDMSFGEAFAAARAEVGPAGVFEWHGQIYNTYTAEEWNGMTAEERAEFSDHFDWNQIDHSESDVAQYSTTTVAESDDIEVVSVNHAENAQPEVVQAEYAGTNAEDVDVEVLGVVHENGMNIGGLSVGGEEVILVDVDGDLTFDFMAADANGNNLVDEGEMVDIQNENLTVGDLGGFTNDPAGNMLASEAGPDYINDAVYEA